MTARVAWEKSELDRALEIVLRTGKVEWGWKKSMQAVKRGGVELVVIAANIPEEAREDLGYYAELAGVGMVEYPGTSWELAEVCGRPHMIMALTIRDAGDSKLGEVRASMEGKGGGGR